MLTPTPKSERPRTTADPAAWKEYWHSIGQPWRTEPEISTERQALLIQLRTVNVVVGQSPLSNVVLSRADLEWLFATEGTVSLPSIRSVTMNPDGSLLLVARSSGDLNLWDLRAGQAIARYSGHGGSVSSCAFSPDGRLALSGSEDTTLRLWDIETGQAVRVLEGHRAAITACLFGRDGRFVVSASEDATLRLWDISSGELLRVLVGHEGAVTACAVSPDGRILLSGAADRTLRLWDLDTGSTTGTLIGHTDGITSCDFSPDGRLSLSGSYDRTLRLWDVATREVAAVLEGHQQAVTACCFSPSGRILASGDNSGVMLTWDSPSGRLLARQIGQDGQINGIAFSPDGERIVLAYDGNDSLQVLDEATGVVLMSLSGPPAPTRGLVCAMYPPMTITRHTCGVLPVYLSPNQAWSLSRADADACALSRDVADGRQQHRPKRFSVKRQTREPTSPDVPRYQRGAYITVVPSASCLRFEPARRTIHWYGALDRLDFMIRVEQDQVEQLANGTVQIFVGPFLFAEVPLTVVISDSALRGDAQSAIKVLGHSFRKVFVSYAHHNAAIVMLLKNTMEAMGDEVLVDAEILRGGGYWQLRLWQAIQQANRFQLFWSKQSANSKHVEDEWRFALSLGKDLNEFIRVCFWSRRPFAIPSELSAFQFEQVHVFRFLSWWRRWWIRYIETR